MDDEREEPVTEELRCWSEGDREAAARVLALVYDQLRGIAAAEFRREREGHTLQPTAVVHEAYLRLGSGQGVQWSNRAQFFAIAARLMRQVLIDHARQKHRFKRGGGAVRVELDEIGCLSAERADELIGVDQALRRLAALDRRQAAIVELRVFGGLTGEETAAWLGVSRATVERQWRHARAWLIVELGEGGRLGS